jgi:hypothetical protein
MAFPDRIDQILTRLDKVEQRIFKDKKPPRQVSKECGQSERGDWQCVSKKLR